jgi:hypothetical protein
MESSLSDISHRAYISVLTSIRTSRESCSGIISEISISMGGWYTNHIQYLCCGGETRNNDIL